LCYESPSLRGSKERRVQGRSLLPHQYDTVGDSAVAGAERRYSITCGFFLNKEKKKYNKENLKISSAAMQKLQEYPWAGNIRELQHAIEKAVILSDGEELGTNDFLLSNNARQEKNTVPTSIEEAEKALIIASLNRNKGNL
jgi:DNA-binding NtrC family response regulator